MTNQELLEIANRYSKERDTYLERYKNDVEYPKLKKAFQELPTTYNRYIQQILGAPVVGKAPINPFVAAGIGNAVAGLGGAVVMGVSAQNEMNKYNERVDLFNKQLASIRSHGEKLAFLVDQITEIISRAPVEVFYDEATLENMVIKRIKASKEGKSSRLAFQVKEEYERFENNEMENAIERLKKKEYITEQLRQLSLSDGYLLMEKYIQDASRDYDSRKRVFQKALFIRCLNDIRDRFGIKETTIIKSAKKEKELKSLTKEEIKDLLNDLATDKVIGYFEEDKSYRYFLFYAKPVIELIERFEQQNAESESMIDDINSRIASYNQKYPTVVEKIEKEKISFNEKKESILTEEEGFINPEERIVADLKSNVAKQEKIIFELSGLAKFFKGNQEQYKLSELKDELAAHEKALIKADEQHQKNIQNKLEHARRFLKEAENELSALKYEKNEIDQLKNQVSSVLGNIDFLQFENALSNNTNENEKVDGGKGDAQFSDSISAVTEEVTTDVSDITIKDFVNIRPYKLLAIFKTDESVVVYADKILLDLDDFDNYVFVSFKNRQQIAVAHDGSFLHAWQNDYKAIECKGSSPVQEDVLSNSTMAFGYGEDGSAYVYCNKAEYNLGSAAELSMVSVGKKHVAAKRTDKTAIAFGDNTFGQCNVTDWINLIWISAGLEHTVGVKEDLTVVAIGSNSYGQCDVSSWKSICMASAGDYHTVGISEDLTKIHATGANENGQCNVEALGNDGFTFVEAIDDYTLVQDWDGNVKTTNGKTIAGGFRRIL